MRYIPPLFFTSFLCHHLSLHRMSFSLQGAQRSHPGISLLVATTTSWAKLFIAADQDDSHTIQTVCGRVFFYFFVFFYTFVPACELSFKRNGYPEWFQSHLCNVHNKLHFLFRQIQLLRYISAFNQCRSQILTLCLGYLLTINSSSDCMHPRLVLVSWLRRRNMKIRQLWS